MAQVTDRNIGANPTGFDMRTEINNIIAALESDNSGSSEPLNTVAYMKWVDTSNATYYYYKERNHDNTAWVTLFRYTVDTKIMEAVSNGVVLSQTNIASDIHASSSKTTPVDADEIGLIDSASTFSLKKLTWANLKATLKTYFDTLYMALTGNQTIAGVKTFLSSPIVPTPAFGDNSTRIATTAFVKNKGVEYSTLITLLSSYTVTSSDIGKIIIVANGATNETLTLPSVASVPVGAVVSILNVNAKGWYIKGSGAEQIYHGTSIANTIVLDGYNSFTCINRGDYWFVLGGAVSSLGAGQGWVDVTGSRALGTVYTNTTSKPIYVVVKYSAGGAGNNVALGTDGITIDQSNSFAASTIYAVGLVGPQRIYIATGLGGSLSAWYEFR